MINRFFFLVLERKQGPFPGFRKQFCQVHKLTPLPDSAKPVGNVLGTLGDAIHHLHMFTSLATMNTDPIHECNSKAPFLFVRSRKKCTTSIASK